MDLRRGNFESDIPRELPEELTDILISRPGVRIERIVSRGHVTPANSWYDQDEHEWVCVLSGAARLEIEGGPGIVELAQGDWIGLPAHVRHRVVWTRPGVNTIWLAVFSDAGL